MCCIWILSFLFLLFNRAVTQEDVVLQASNCEQLREILQNIQRDKRVVVTDNMRCSRDVWQSAIYTTHQTLIEGSKFSKGVPAIDWADTTNAIVVQQFGSLTFQNVVLIQDFVQLGGLKLSFVSGFDDSSVEVLGVGIGIRSCPQRLDQLIPIYEGIPRPISGEQEIYERSSDTLFIKNVAFRPPRGDNATWTLCNSVFQCSVNSPFQKEFQETLQTEALDPTCASGNLQALNADDSGVSGGSTSSETFAVIVVAFTAISTTLVLLFLFVLFKFVVIPLVRKQKRKPRRSDEENQNSTQATDASSGISTKPRSIHKSSASLLSTTIQLTEIELGVPLGKGTMGIVYKGYINDKPLAVKVVDLEASETFVHDNDPISKYLKERFHHPNVIETLLYQTHRMEELQQPSPVGDPILLSGGSFSEMSLVNETPSEDMHQYRTFHVMEFCNLGSLEKAMTDGVFKSPEGELKLPVILRTALDIAKGMRYLHSLKIVHGQLRPSNILLKGDAMDTRGFVCKISDFGLNHLHEKQQVVEMSQGRNISYRAPETLRKGTVENGTDVFAFGMVLWSMVSSQSPFEGCDPAETIATILEGTRPQIPPDIPRKYERLIKDCWHADKSARPPFANIIERLGRITAQLLRPTDSNASSSHHRRFERSYCSSTDMETIHNGSGSIQVDPLLDTVEIHDANSEIPF